MDNCRLPNSYSQVARAPWLAWRKIEASAPSISTVQYTSWIKIYVIVGSTVLSNMQNSYKHFLHPTVSRELKRSFIGNVDSLGI